MSICKYCGGEVTWVEDPLERKPDGSPRVKPYNINGSRHNCEQFEWAMEAKRREFQAKIEQEQKLEQAARMVALAKLWNLPVYCPFHGIYEPNDNPCEIILHTGFIPHKDGTNRERWSYPPNWYFNWWSENRHKKHMEKFHKGEVSWAHEGTSVMEQYL